MIHRKVNRPSITSYTLAAGLIVVIFTSTSLADNGPYQKRLALIEQLLASSENTSAISLARSEIQALEKQTNRYDDSLVQPLILLGRGLHAVSEYSEAIDVFSRARHLLRINRGLHDVSQTKILYLMAEAEYARGEIYQANSLQETATDIYTRAYGEESLMVLPGIFNLADWYLRTYNIYAARSIYEHAAQLSADADGWGSPNMIHSLRGIHKTYMLERFQPPDMPKSEHPTAPEPRMYSQATHIKRMKVNDFAPGERALIDILKMLMTSENAAPREIALAKMDLADWYLLFEVYDRAFVIYEDIWGTTLNDTEMSDVSQQLTNPTPLYLPVPNDPFSLKYNRTENKSEGFVATSMTITDRGKPKQIKVIQSSPQGMLDEATIIALKKGRYRPAFNQGKPVVTKDVRYEHRFHYLQPDS